MKTPHHTPPLAWDGQDVPALMSLEKLDENLFRSQCNQRNLNGALYGGQVFGQALAAAVCTVEEGRAVHSCHGYFLRPGDGERRIVLEVERTRDGGSFSSRRVVALQNGLAILHLECSFHAPEDGFEHSLPVDLGATPESLGDLGAVLRSELPEVPRFLSGIVEGRGPIQVRPVLTGKLLEPSAAARRRYWLRVNPVETDDPAAHRVMLAYLSDWWFAGVSLMPHAPPLQSEAIFISSIDHAIWFHRDARADDWLLFDADSPSASHGVGLARGLIYDREGRLVASIMQEALLRKRREKK